jgi:hypothetical protein
MTSNDAVGIVSLASPGLPGALRHTDYLVPYILG